MHHSTAGWPVRFGVGVAFLLTLGCTPYPVYNGDGTPPREAVEDEAVPEDYAPAVESRRLDRTWKSAGTSIDERLFRRVVDAYLGTPYKRGGDNLRGIDCSNLVHAIYRDYDGTKLPENTRTLFRLPDAVESNELQIGDLVFFDFADTRGPSHVGVYLGRDKFVHASETAGVIISSLEDATYRDAFRGGRRVAAPLHSGE